ncbi:MAG: 16S rRNA (adenine(1518)-N(6)/adenine(1519)-N(6))-dimethyltransferase RsmA [Gemmatimonadaceae bacterium]|jgi:16S rRNA (adenine1518-N6/adenine1519-N6)-dimethyltransferase|nr:16S rRNA (adenine(1518)-N(6)/adenine(1519)-N(6))-dimethyltransferase RsmA [Gemmatimonadaceae bacterium]
MTGAPRAKKRLGQHFLHDQRVLERIAEAVAPMPGETVVEVGPGEGALTDRLAERATRLVAIELDRDLVPRLRARYAGRSHVEILEADVLEVDLAAVAGGPYVLAGNVPYYITTPILFHALRAPRPRRAVYLVQKEVADRVVAPAGHDDYGALSVNVQALAVPRRLFTVGPGAFRPAPSVESAVFVVEPRPDPLVTAAEEAPFQRFVVAMFGQRRKQLVRALREVTGHGADIAQAIIAQAGLAPTSRGETVSPEGFVRLFRATASIS